MAAPPMIALPRHPHDAPPVIPRHLPAPSSVCNPPQLSPLLLHTLHQLISHVVWCRGSPLCKMELSESVQRGLRSLADPSAFGQSSFQVLVDVSFRSLLSSRGDPAVLGEPLPLPRRRFCLRRCFRFPSVWMCGRAASMFVFFFLTALLRLASRSKPVSPRLYYIKSKMG